MESSARSARKTLRALGAFGAIVLLTTFATQTASAAHRGASTATVAAAHKCVVATGSGDEAFVRNFNPFNGGSMRDFTQGGIYENLVISTAFGGGRVYNVLAKKLAFSKDGKTLTITIHPNVKWSDGKPLTNRDVLYSLTAGRQDKYMDRINLVGDNTNIASVRLAGANKVAIRFKQVDATFVGSILSTVFIVPQHIWSKVRNVDTFTNSNPVGSGPFTRITRFNGQDYVLSKNPHYWQRGLPRVPCIERIAASGNDAALLQIVSGQADWTHNFVPNVERAYIAHDKKHYHASYLGVGLPIDLFFDLTKYPYSLPAFRKGVSQAIDRNKVVKLGEYGYAPAVNALGIEKIYPTWIDPKLVPLAKKLATYNQAAAKKAFTDAGFTYKSGNLYDPKGDRVSFQIHRDRRLVRLGCLAPDHREEPAGRRHRRIGEARARLGRMAAERDEHEVHDAALELRRERHHAVRVLLFALRAPRRTSVRASTPRRQATGSTTSSPTAQRSSSSSRGR